MLPRFSTEICSTGDLDQFGNPISGRHQWLEPLQARNRRFAAKFGGLGTKAFEAATQFHNQFVPTIRLMQRGGHDVDVSKQLLQLLRMEINHAGTVIAERQSHFQILWRDGANITLRLSQDDIGTKFSQQRGIDFINRQPFTQVVFDLPVDLGSGMRGINSRATTTRQPLHFRRKIAFMRAADEMLDHSQGGNDFRGAWQKRNDPKSM